MIVLAQPPSLEGNAPGRCAVALLRGLARNGVDVTAVAARQPFAADADVPADLRVEVVDVDVPSAGFASVGRRIRRPRGSLAGDFAARVRELATAADVLHLEETETAWCDAGVDRPSSIHLHFRTLRDRRIPPPWRNEFRFIAEYVAAEVVAIRRHRFLVANSAPVAHSLRRLNSHAEVVVAPLSLDPSHYEVATPAPEPRAGIIGTGSWPPTADAIRRLTAIWPAVRGRVPDARLLVAGRGTERLAPPGAAAAAVDFVGDVPSAGEFLRSLSLLLYPTSRGSGMKVKVLEAMASGVPVVTTPAGAEGIDPTEGVVVCETDAALASAAASILADGGEQRRRAAAAREAFVARYAPEPATRSLAGLFRRMAGGDS